MLDIRGLVDPRNPTNNGVGTVVQHLGRSTRHLHGRNRLLTSLRLAGLDIIRDIHLNLCLYLTSNLESHPKLRRVSSKHVVVVDVDVKTHARVEIDVMDVVWVKVMRT